MSATAGGAVFLLGVLGLPWIALSGGRQADISSTTNTGQERIQLWNEGLTMFQSNPLFGVGPDGYKDWAGHVAHNSYMQAFGEFGLIGGVLFLGAVVLAIGGLYRLGQPIYLAGRWTAPHIEDPDLQQIYPFLLGAVTAYATGMFTLTLNALVTTYAFIGLAALFLDLATTRPIVVRDPFGPGLLLKLTGLGIMFMCGMFVLVRLTFRG